MNQSTVQLINVQLQNNNSQPHGPQNIGRHQNTNGHLQRASNTGRTQNLFNNISIAVQSYADLVEGTYPFTRTQSIENPLPQSVQFST
ncbi:25331_t:CDS:1, partial [Racocetra persica]